ncbi:hypothetical protein GCM10027275_19770 [Rhabdobacter roseus]|uniref:DUF5723 domain-containing protein n=1 Tax=Rhabdobacter roseus TaxID=1655419 RepID=A0A840TRP2_9BACT|nr:DUF5723 family protein [Rhabdobacter roseus]MBB5283903.1 hypothetical protein [Rhabdobacter roseus]
MHSSVAKYLFALGFFLLVGSAQAQRFIGIATQSNAGLHSVYQNPATLADSRYAFRFHVATAGLHLDNNYVRYAAPFSMIDLLRGNNPRSLDPYDLEEIRDGKPKNGTLSAEIRGPAVAFRLGEKTQVALMTRVRSGFQITNASERLLTVARLGLANAESYQDLGFLALYATQTDNAFNAVTQAYSEWALALGQVLSESETHRLKGGVTVKRLFGNAGGYVQNRSLNYQLIPDPESPNGVMLQVDRFDADMGYTQVNNRSFLSPKWLFGQNTVGQGWGLDLGLTYEWLAQDGETPVLQLGASLTDLGRIRYEGSAVSDYTIQTGGQQMTQATWEGYTTPQEGESTLSAVGRMLEQEFGLNETNRQSQFTIATPRALNLSADLRLAGNFYVNTTLVQGFKQAQAPAWRQTSLWAVAPRYESQKLGVVLPIIQQNGAWAVGTSLRLGPVVLGSDNLLGVFARNGRIKAQGVDIYAGLSFGVRAR